MQSWRKTALDILNGIDTSTGESVREAIDRCRCEPPAPESGSFSEAVQRISTDEQKLRSTVRELEKRLAKMDKWVQHDDRPWDIAPNKILLPIQRGFDLLDKIWMNDRYTQAAVDRLQSAVDTADSIVSPLIKAEEEKAAKYSKTPCGKIFQELVFGWKRETGSRSHEKDTEKESNIKDKVGDYIGGNMVDAGIVKAMNQLKSCVKEYPDALRPTVTHAWRGISVRVSTAMRFLPMAALLKSNNLMQIGKQTYVGARGVHKVSRPIESWAAEPKVADQFANQGLNYWSKHSTLSGVIKSAKKMVAGKPMENERWTTAKDIADEFASAYQDIMEMDLSIVYEIKVDGDFIFAEWFADSISQDEYLGKESEVTRVSEVGTEKPATVYVKADFIRAVKEYNQTVQELRGIMGAKMPKKIKEITFG